MKNGALNGKNMGKSWEDIEKRNYKLRFIAGNSI
jgi:hypothetical protein